MRTMKLAPETDLSDIAARLPPNFTGADFSALTSEAYMIAAKERIEIVQAEIKAFKEQTGMNSDDQLLPETYFKLKYPDDEDMQARETKVEVRGDHLLKSLL